MSEFSAVANLAVSVDQSSLRAARRTIESEMAGPTVGASARPTGGGRNRMLDLLEEQNDILREIEEQGLGRGGGGGGGGFGFGAGLAAGGARGLASAGSTALAALALTAGVGATAATLGQRAGRIDFSDPASIAFGNQGDKVGQFSFERLFQNLGLGGGRDVTRQFDTTFNINNRVSVSQSLQQSERQRFEQAASREEVERTINTELQRFEQRLRRQLGDDSSRTTSRSGGGTGGAQLR